MSNIPESGGPAWVAWNQEWFARFNLSFTGFVIQGDAGILTKDAETMYDQFSPAGIVIGNARDRADQKNDGRVTDGGTPVMHHIADLPGGDVNGSAKMVQDFVASGKGSPVFGVFRTILQSATFHYDVAEQASKNTVGFVVLCGCASLSVGQRSTLTWLYTKGLK